MFTEYPQGTAFLYRKGSCERLCLSCAEKYGYGRHDGTVWITDTDAWAKRCTSCGPLVNCQEHNFAHMLDSNFRYRYMRQDTAKLVQKVDRTVKAFEATVDKLFDDLLNWNVEGSYAEAR